VDDFLDFGVAVAAGLAGAVVDAVFELEEAADSVGVYVVGDRRTSELNGVAEDGLERGMKAQQARAGDAASDAGGADAGAEEAFVGVDVADSVKEFLIEESGFDGELAATEEGDKIVGGYGEWFAAGALEWLCVFNGVEAKATEAAGVYEAELVTGAEGEAAVGVRWDGDGGVGVEQAASHAEVDEELVGGGFGAEGFEVKDDVFADAMDARDAESGEGGGHDFGVGLEGFAGAAEGGGEDALAVGAVVDALGYGFDLWEFGHGVGLVSHCGGWVGEWGNVAAVVLSCDRVLFPGGGWRYIIEVREGKLFPGPQAQPALDLPRAK
jgi:hypothetical protein